MTEELRILFGKGTSPQPLREIQELVKYIGSIKPEMIINLLDASDMDTGRFPYPAARYVVDGRTTTEHGIVAVVGLVLSIRE